MKYIKKPIEIEAEKTDEVLYIDTLEGKMKADKGDYIITGIHGEKYPCKPDIFEESYVKAPENFIERMIQEKHDLDVKIGKLEKWIDSHRQTSEDLEDIELKQNQLNHMIPYSNILKIRIQKAKDDVAKGII